MTTFLLCSLTVYGLLFLWFRTTALIEYAQFFGLARRMRIPEWLEFRKVHQDKDISYLGFARLRVGLAPEGASIFRILRAFAVRMLTCPACTGLWFALAVSIAAGQWHLFLAVYGLSMVLFERV